MKFRTTVLLIVFSFTLLLLWDEWISYNTKILVAPEPNPNISDQTNIAAVKENEYSSDLPSVDKLKGKNTCSIKRPKITTITPQTPNKPSNILQ